MKKLNQIGIGLLVFIILGFGPVQADSIVQITAEVQGLEAVSLADLPPFGTYWCALPGGVFAPMPIPPLDSSLPAYALTDEIYLVDQTGGLLPRGDTISAMEIESNSLVNLINQVQEVELMRFARMMDLDLPDVPAGNGSMPTNIYPYNINTNLLWLQITNVANGTAYANLYNATDQVYAIWSTTNLSLSFTNWQVETEVFPTNTTTNRLAFTVPTLGRQDLFLWAQDWTSVDSNGDGIPDWWIWQYFGDLSETATNVDNLGHTLGYDYENEISPTNPLTVNIIWPQEGTYIAGENFTVEAQVNDLGASIVAVIVNPGGITNTVTGWVGHNGISWAENLPVTPGANLLTLMATNAFGNFSKTTVTLSESDLTVTMNPLSSEQLNQLWVNVTGTVSDSAAEVWVNGVEATNVGGIWAANAVPVSPAGMAIFDVEASAGTTTAPASPGSSGSQHFIHTQSAMVVLSDFGILGYYTNAVEGWWATENSQWNWENGGPINYFESFLSYVGSFGFSPYDQAEEYLPPSSQPSDRYLGTTWEYSSIRQTNEVSTLNREVTTKVMIVSPDDGAAGTNVYLVRACASEFSHPYAPEKNYEYEGFTCDAPNGPAGEWHIFFCYTPPGWYAGDLPMPPEWLQINGHALVNTGITNATGSFWGATLVSGLAKTNVDVTPIATQYYTNNDYTFDVKAEKLHLIITDANGTDLTLQTNTVIVGQQMNLTCKFSITNSFMTNFVLTNFQWTVPGYTLTNWYTNGFRHLGNYYPTNGYSLPLTATNNQGINFFWTDGVTNIASASNFVVLCSASVGGVSVMAQATFNVLKPIVKISPVTSAVVLGDCVAPSHTYSLCFGTNPAPGAIYSPGIRFSTVFQMPAGTNYNYGDDRASFEWWQVISNYRIRSYYIAGTPPDILEITNQLVFDQSIPYPFDLNFTFPDTSDSPSVPALTSIMSGVSLDFHATMWLMFHPGNGQWVPVRSVPWDCSGSATNNGSGWVLISRSWSTNPPDFDGGKSYPIWTNNIASWGIGL